MVLQEIAHRGGQRPSELAGIDCAYCAYCFDETLLAARWKEQEQEIKKTEEQERMQRLRRTVGLN